MHNCLVCEPTAVVFFQRFQYLSLVGTDLSLAELRKQKVLAQSNARMGMMVALGEIQKHLGPDTRVSTTADILDERVETNDFYLNQNYDPNLSVSRNGQIRVIICLLYTSPSPRDVEESRMPSSA